MRIGFSYHDSAELLDRILTEHPNVDVVQIQLNYLDWDSAGIQSRLCYETCVKHGKKVIVMEPLKGGTLSSLPGEAEQALRAARPDWSAADWGLRFAQSMPEVETVLSGMVLPSQIRQNMEVPAVLTEEDRKTLFSVRGIITGKTSVACTGCRYCETHCPQRIPIPDYFAMFNELCRSPEDGWKILPSYESMSASRGRASECIGCGQCAEHCPQHLDIPRIMKEAAAALESA